MRRLNLTVIMITYNEEFHIEKAVDQFVKLGADVKILDSFSVDDTVEKATLAGAEVFQRKFYNFSDQWNFALLKIPISTKWVMKFDPDERINDELAKEIQSVCSDKSSCPASGYSIRRDLYFMGQKLNQTQNVIRLWQKGKGFFDGKIVNEHPIIDGKVSKLKGKILHLDSPSLHHWINKQNNYSTLEACVFVEKALLRNPNLSRAKFKFLRACFMAFINGDGLSRSILFVIPGRYQILTFFYFLKNISCGSRAFLWISLRVRVYKDREIKARNFLDQMNLSELSKLQNSVHKRPVIISKLSKKIFN